MNLPKKRGWPKVVAPQPAKFFVVDASSDRLEGLSQQIAEELGRPDASEAKNLTEIAIRCDAMTELRCKAPKKTASQGNRTNIHVQELLIECAEFHESLTGQPATSSLAGIEYAEEWGRPHKTLEYAKAILATLKIHHNSLSWQARKAKKTLEDRRAIKS